MSPGPRLLPSRPPHRPAGTGVSLRPGCLSPRSPSTPPERGRGSGAAGSCTPTRCHLRWLPSFCGAAAPFKSLVLLSCFLLNFFFLIVSLHQPLIFFSQTLRPVQPSGRAGSCGSPEISRFSPSPLHAAVGSAGSGVTRLQLLLLVSFYHQTVIYLPGSAYYHYFFFTPGEKKQKKFVFGHFLQT